MRKRAYDIFEKLHCCTKYVFCWCPIADRWCDTCRHSGKPVRNTYMYETDCYTYLLYSLCYKQRLKYIVVAWSLNVSVVSYADKCMRQTAKQRLIYHVYDMPRMPNMQKIDFLNSLIDMTILPSSYTPRTYQDIMMYHLLRSTTVTGYTVFRETILRLEYHLQDMLW